MARTEAFVIETVQIFLLHHAKGLGVISVDGVLHLVSLEEVHGLD